MALVRRRRGHTCKASVVLMAIVAWDGIHPDRANVLYTQLSTILSDRLPDNIPYALNER